MSLGRKLRDFPHSPPDRTSQPVTHQYADNPFSPCTHPSSYENHHFPPSNRIPFFVGLLQKSRRNGEDYQHPVVPSHTQGRDRRRLGQTFQQGSQKQTLIRRILSYLLITTSRRNPNLRTCDWKRKAVLAHGDQIHVQSFSLINQYNL